MNDASFSDTAFVERLGKFLDVLLRHIEKEIKSWCDKTMEVAKQKNIDELYKLPPLRVVVPSSSHLSKGT